MLTFLIPSLNCSCEFEIKIGVKMLEFLLKKCTHDKISAGLKSGYCPDCGEYIENHWYITRCSCCGVKQKTLVKNGKVVAITKFCKNCGSSVFKAQEVELDIVTINYAAVLKKTIPTRQKSLIQTWVENVENVYSPKLLPSFN